MKSFRQFLLCWILIVGGQAWAQVILTGTSYSENFNGITDGLPTGWSVYTSATASSLGSSGTFYDDPIHWSSSSVATSGFRNIASDSIAYGASMSTQNTTADRAFGWRPLGATTGVRDGALTLTLANTTGFTGFSLSVSLFTANDVSGSQTYSLEYRVGNTGSFTPIATYTTPNSGASTFNAQTLSASSVTLSALNDQSSPVYLRLRGTATSGTNLDTVGFDDFSLSYSAAAVPEPSTYAAIAGAVVFVTAVWQRRRQKTARATQG